MGNIQIMALCAIFGGVCALYVSVVGFTVSAIAVIGVLIVFSRLAGGVYHAWAMVGAFVTLQAGYFICLVGLAVFGRMRKTVKQAKSTKTDFHIDHD